SQVPPARGGRRGATARAAVGYESMLRFVAYSHAGVQRFPVPRTSAVIGSDADCEICIQQAGVAARHAQLSWDGDELRIADLGSRRGLVVNGKRVEEAGLQVLDEI